MTAASVTAASVTADLGESNRVASPAARKHGFWRRLHNAIVESRMRQAEREIATYLDLNGGRFTDQMERRILDRVSGIDRRSFGA
jgi:hypothetical protein